MKKKYIFVTINLLGWFLIINCDKSDLGTIDNENNSDSNYLTITEVEVGQVLAGDSRMISFDLIWENNWKTSSCPENWDAVWIFAKCKIGNEDWKHVTLSNISSEHIIPLGYAVKLPLDGKGVFIYKDDGNENTFNISDISLKWNFKDDNISSEGDISVKVFGIEMVYIPEGSFYAGDNGTSYASLVRGYDDNRPWYISSENEINVTNTTSDGYYYNSSKDIWNEQWNECEDPTGAEFTIPEEFPKGYRAIYCMKYELSQQQYVDFLNTLNDEQASNSYDRPNYNQYGYTILVNNGVYSTSHPNRACGFISPADGFAYADWAGLRPMTELEYEKICRGSNNPVVNGEFAWGTISAINVTSASGTEGDRSHITNHGANCSYSDGTSTVQFPLNVGIFAGTGKIRKECGATYYGVMEMSGNLSETCISIGTSFGRVFTYHNGDGQLSDDGFANESNWPNRDGRGAGFKGGNFAREKHEMRISERLDATVSIDYHHRHIPIGFRCVRTVY